MRLEEAVFSYLTANTDVKNRIADRLYPLLLPQDCLFPSVVYSLVSIERTPALERDSGFVKQILQFSCHAKSYKESVNVVEIIRNTLQNFKGDMVGLDIGAILIKLEVVTFEPDTKNYIAIIEFEFQFNEGR